MTFLCYTMNICIIHMYNLTNGCFYKSTVKVIMNFTLNSHWYLIPVSKIYMQGFKTGIKKGFKYQWWINITIVSESVRVYANACIHNFIFKDKCLWYNIKLRNYLINEWSWIFLHFSSKLLSLSSVPLFSIILVIFQPSTFNLLPFLSMSFLSMSL